ETLETGAIGTATAEPILEKLETLETGAIGTATTNTIAEQSDFVMVISDWLMGELFLLER
ncbi:hypothetical protein, partial [Nostoc sp.]|uniref:hypothetical protein n=1 Tax=Nostoc sp. TaxID=1180 RepID=UPI002FF9DA4F